MNTAEFYAQNDIKHKWIRLEQSLEEVRQHNLALQNFGSYYEGNLNPLTNEMPQEQLELVGQKADVRFERRLDHNFRRERSALLI